MAGYSRPEGGWRFTFLGTKTNTPADAVDPRKYPYTQNVRSVDQHTVQTRPGYSLLFTTPDSGHSPLDIVTACPTDEPQVGIEYFYQLSADGGTPPYSWLITAGGLPAGISLSSGGIIGGIRANDSSSGDWTATVTDSGIPPEMASIMCSFNGGGGGTVVDVMYTESSPRTDPGALATPYFYILPPSRDILYRSSLPNGATAPGSWSTFSTEAIPGGITPRRIFGNDSNGVTSGLADDAQMMTKALCSTGADPLPQTDNAWIAYPLPGVPKPNGNNPAINPDNGFWLPSNLGSPPPLGYIGVDGVLHSQRSLGGCTTYEDIDDGTNTLPAGTWNRIFSIQNLEYTYAGAIMVGNGSKVAVWLNAASAWTLNDCPEGDYRDISIPSSSNTLVAVGIGDTPVIQSLDYGATWSAYTSYPGWTPVAPRVIFDPNMNVVTMGHVADTSGTFIVTGGTVSGSEVVMLIPLMSSDDSLGTALLAGLPSVSATTVWRAATTNGHTVGALVVGVDTAIDPTDPLAVIIVANPELSQSGSPATYDDWHLRTLAQSPFGGLT